MVDREMLEAMAQLLDERDKKLSDMMDSKLKPMNDRLDSIDERLAGLEEESKITRTSVNMLLEWAEEAQIQVKIPLFKKAE